LKSSSGRSSDARAAAIRESNGPSTRESSVRGPPYTITRYLHRMEKGKERGEERARGERERESNEKCSICNRSAILVVPSCLSPDHFVGSSLLFFACSSNNLRAGDSFADDMDACVERKGTEGNGRCGAEGVRKSA
jgi:hypothetical protein